MTERRHYMFSVEAEANDDDLKTAGHSNPNALSPDELLIALQELGATLDVEVFAEWVVEPEPIE